MYCIHICVSLPLCFWWPRYLFNCGEGTQRLAHEHKVKLSTMEHILITHKSWENVGGLPGMLLTLQDTGVPFITLHGPPGIVSLMQFMECFSWLVFVQMVWNILWLLDIFKVKAVTQPQIGFLWLLSCLYFYLILFLPELLI